MAAHEQKGEINSGNRVCWANQFPKTGKRWANAPQTSLLRVAYNNVNMNSVTLTIIEPSVSFECSAFAHTLGMIRPSTAVAACKATPLVKDTLLFMYRSAFLQLFSSEFDRITRFTRPGAVYHLGAVATGPSTSHLCPSSHPPVKHCKFSIERPATTNLVLHSSLWIIGGRALQVQHSMSLDNVFLVEISALTGHAYQAPQ